MCYYIIGERYECGDTMCRHQTQNRTEQKQLRMKRVQRSVGRFERHRHRSWLSFSTARRTPAPSPPVSVHLLSTEDETSSSECCRTFKTRDRREHARLCTRTVKKKKRNYRLRFVMSFTRCVVLYWTGKQYSLGEKKKQEKNQEKRNDWQQWKLNDVKIEFIII